MKTRNIVIIAIAGLFVVAAGLFAAGRAGGPAGAAEGPKQTLVERAKADLSKQTGVAAGEIEVISAEEVEWADGSLGCAEPGMSYIQVITPGFKIELEAGGKVYSYHTDAGEHIVQCNTGGIVNK